MSRASAKVENDPWLPLPESSTAITAPPVDPLRQLIDSERYIESLGDRLFLAAWCTLSHVVRL